MGNFYTFFSVHMSKAFYLSHCWLRLKICLPNPCVRRQTRQTYTSTSDDSEVDLGQRCCSDVWRQVNGFFRPCLVIVFGRATSCMSIVLVYTTDIMLFSISKYYFFLSMFSLCPVFLWLGSWLEHLGMANLCGIPGSENQISSHNEVCFRGTRGVARLPPCPDGGAASAGGTQILVAEP